MNLFQNWVWFALGSAFFAALTALFGKLGVAFAIVLGIVFVGEKPTWPVALGGGLIVAGSIVIILF
jgi:uncharacterized membrane protein